MKEEQSYNREIVMQNEITAIIDIGYNAIRAVVYGDKHPGAPEIFSDKFKSDLASLLESEDLDIKHHSYLTIEYLLHIFKNLGVTKINCVATAILREHPKAQSFVKYIKKKYNFDIKILTGQEEARLTALGLIHGIECQGLAADLGGGSLELVEIDDANISRFTSLKLGTKLITEQNLDDLDKITAIIEDQYGKESQYENLYLIGGSMRFIGRLYIDHINHPIKNLHHLEIDVNSFEKYLDSMLESLHNPKYRQGQRRINSSAILVAKAMINIFNPKKVVISTYGLKEGVRFESLNLPYKNVLESKVAYACEYDLNKTDFQAYHDVLSILTRDADLMDILRLAIMFNSLKGWVDRTLPPRALVEYILAAEIPIPQNYRLMIAIIINVSSDFRIDSHLTNISKQILSKEEYVNSQIIGHFLSIAESIDGPNFVKPSFGIKLINRYYELEYEHILPRPIFEKIRFRLKSAAHIIRNKAKNVSV